MMHRFGSGFVAIMATASIVLAGGDGETKKGEGEKGQKSTRTLEGLATGSTAQGTSLTAKAGEGITIDNGDDFSLNLRTWVQARWTYANYDTGGDIQNFSVPRARVDMMGHAFHDDVTYRVQVDFTSQDGGTGLVRDAYGRWKFWSNEEGNSHIGLRFGQQKPRHGKEFTGSGRGLDHIRRSVATRIFAANRVTGAFLEGAHLEGSKLHWAAGVANNDVAGGATNTVESGTPAVAPIALEAGNATGNADNELNFYADIRFDPFGDMGGDDMDSAEFMQGDLAHSEELMASIGAGLMIGNAVSTTLTDGAGPADVESTSININAAAKMKGFFGLAEVFVRSDDPSGTGNTEADSIGWNVSGSYVLPKPEDGGTQWGGALRISQVDFDDPAVMLTTGMPTGAGSGLGTGAGDVLEVTATVNAFYHEHNAKTQLAYTWQSVSPDGGTDADNSIIEVQFQLAF